MHTFLVTCVIDFSHLDWTVANIAPHFPGQEAGPGTLWASSKHVASGRIRCGLLTGGGSEVYRVLLSLHRADRTLAESEDFCTVLKCPGKDTRAEDLISHGECGNTFIPFHSYIQDLLTPESFSVVPT